MPVRWMVPPSDVSGDEKFHAVWVRVQNDKKSPPLYVCSVYVPCARGRMAQAHYHAALDDMLLMLPTKATKAAMHVILAGDFNARVRHRDAPTVRRACVARPRP